jgi:hypothetical protein
MWDIDGEASFQVDGKIDEPIHIVDVQGRDVDPHHVAGELPQLKLSQAPIYVTGLPDNLSLRPMPQPVVTPAVYLFP